MHQDKTREVKGHVLPLVW